MKEDCSHVSEDCSHVSHVSEDCSHVSHVSEDCPVVSEDCYSINGIVSSLSASEECPEESSDANFFNITFCLPGKDFGSFFPYSINLINKITSVSIPQGVTEIKADSFKGFSLLANITIPNSVTKIGKNAFSGCSSLTNITIPNSIKKIGKNILPYSFLFNKTNLNRIQIPNIVRSVMCLDFFRKA